MSFLHCYKCLSFACPFWFWYMGRRPVTYSWFVGFWFNDSGCFCHGGRQCSSAFLRLKNPSVTPNATSPYTWRIKWSFQSKRSWVSKVMAWEVGPQTRTSRHELLDLEVMKSENTGCSIIMRIETSRRLAGTRDKEWESGRQRMGHPMQASSWRIPGRLID